MSNVDDDIVSELNNEGDPNVDNEVDEFLAPYRKLLSDQEELNVLKFEKCLNQCAEKLNQVETFQMNVCEIDKNTLKRLKVITNSANLLKHMLKEPIGSDCMPVGHQFQKQIISAVESLIAFTNNFPQMMEIASQAPTTEGAADILMPLEDAVRQFEIAISNGENSLENINQCRDRLESIIREAHEGNINSVHDD